MSLHTHGGTDAPECVTCKGQSCVECGPGYRIGDDGCRHGSAHKSIEKEVPMIETAKFERIPFEVEAVQVTEENLEELAAWCDGVVNRKRRDGKVFVEVSVVNPRIEPRNAFVGDWILKATKGFKVYNSQAFEKCFRPAAQTVVPVAYNGHSHLVSITCHDGCPLWAPEPVVVEES